MSLFGKGVSAAAVGTFFYLNGKFGTLFWVLMILVLLDIIFNLTSLGNLENQFKKIGSAVFSLGGPVLFLNAYKDGEMAKILVAVLVLAYLEILYPQVKPLLAHLKIPKKDETVLLAEISRLRGDLDRMAKEAITPPTSMNHTSLTKSVNESPNQNSDHQRPPGPQVGGNP